MRSLADRQERAAAASRWRRDARRPSGPSLAVRRRAAKLLKASKRAEDRYVRDVARVMRGVHQGVLGLVDEQLGSAPVLEERAAGGYMSPEQRADAARPSFPASLTARLFAHIRAHVGPAFDRMAHAVNGENKEGLELLGISPAVVPGLAGTLASAREENIRLLQKSATKYMSQVEDVLRDPENLGLRVEELRDLLVERGQVSESRASLIARDQTLKTNAAVSHARMSAAGVERGRWSTSQDEKVRPMHRALEGVIFDLDDPPITNEEGEHNAPGEDIQCRCITLPIIAELEDPLQLEPEEAAAAAQSFEGDEG